jgi:hypothetical protein
MVKVSFAALFSKRRDWIFNPFPWCFKTSDHFSTDILGQAAPPNRDYKYLEDCTKIIDIDDLFTLISEVSTDQDLINKLNECNPIGIGLY